MSRRSLRSIAVACLLLVLAGLAVIFWQYSASHAEPYRSVSTVAGIHGEFGEPFGIAVRGQNIYVSDGQNGKIWSMKGDSTSIFAEGLDTPSGMAFDKSGNLLVADPGTNTIKSIDVQGRITLVAGVERHSGFADGDAAAALFTGPIGVAVGEDKIF